MRFLECSVYFIVDIRSSTHLNNLYEAHLIGVKGHNFGMMDIEYHNKILNFDNIIEPNL